MRLLNAHFPARTLFLGISEGCLVVLAFLLATVVRLGTTDAAVMLKYEQGFVKIAIIACAFTVCMYYFELYDASILANRREVLTRIAQVLGTLFIALALLYSLYPPLELRRGVLSAGFILLTILIFLWRHLFIKVNSLSQFSERALILGAGPLAEPLCREFSSRPELGVAVVGRVSELSNDGTSQPAEIAAPPETLSGAVAPQEFCRFVRNRRINRIVVVMGDRRGKLPVELLLSLKSSGVLVQDGTDVYESITGKVPAESLRLGWLLFSPGFCLRRSLLIYKRIASVIVSTVGLIVSLPFLPFVVLAIKLTSPGPVLYRQERVGKDGRIFECFKFRTMRADAEADSGPTWAKDDDPRITRIGHLLRLTRMDEIPQLWNVLKGDMTLVGPRPERPEFVESLAHEINYYQLRHTVRPGITGWAQVRYKYGNSVDDAREKLRYDLFYIKNLSPGLDLLIFFQTIKTIIWRKGAQ
jgi:sugar transferase (PEP-CTERM system associated)